MALREVCLCEGEYIGIETIYTVIDGKQINIPGKVEELRESGRKKKLFCPCGCGSNLILIAGDKNIREQHFRIYGDSSVKCSATSEEPESLNSRIILKCWLDDKIHDTNIKTRVPINRVENTNRKYEFSFLSIERKLALSYTYEKGNLTDEKIDVLESNGQDIHIIYIVDGKNDECNGQYPERLIKLQKQQGYCLFLKTCGIDYKKALLKAAFYEQDLDGLWNEITFANEELHKFDIDNNGDILLSGITLRTYKEDAYNKFTKKQDDLRYEREEEEKKQKEEAERLRAEQEHLRKERKRKKEDQRRADEEEKNRRKEKTQQENQERFPQMLGNQNKVESEQCREVVSPEWIELLSQSNEVAWKDGKRWIQCEYCKKIGTDSEFVTYGGAGKVNLGLCYSCENRPEVKAKAEALRMRLTKKG